MYVKGLFEVFKVLGRIGIKPKDVIGMGGDIVKMGKSLFNTRINPKLITFIEKNQKIPTKILENIKLHARTLKNASESQKNLFLENIKSIQNAKTGIKPEIVPKKGMFDNIFTKMHREVMGPPKVVKSSSPVTGVKQPATSVKEQALESFKGWKPTVIKGGKDKLATGGIANHFRERVGFSRAGMVAASNPLLRGTTGSSQILKAPRGYTGMQAILALENLPEPSFLKKNEDESIEDIVERIETIKKEPDQKPPEDPKWKKALEIAEKATFDTASKRIKQKILNFYENKIVTKVTQDETRDMVNNTLGELRKEYPKLFDKITTSHVKKDGTVGYVFATPKGKIYGNSLEDIAAKRLNYFGETPTGTLSTDEVAQVLYENKFGEKDIKTIKQRISQKFLEDYGVEYTRGGERGGKKLYLNKEQFENVLPKLLKEYSTDNQKIEVAKQLLMTHDITSMNQLAKAMKELGYLKWGEKTRERFRKIFPDILQTKYRGGEGIPKNLSVKIRRNLIKEFGAPTVERALIDYKEALGYGESTQIMHTRPKKKLTETLYDTHDLMFGSGKENKAYAYGLDRIRSQVQNNLRKIQHNYSKKDWENNMTVDVSPLLRKDFGFPKRMTLQKYTNKLNSMITDLSLATDGKVTGGMLDESTWDFVETKVGVDWSKVPGGGLIKENLQKINPLFKKLRYEMKEEDKGRQRLVINQETGMPEVKKGVKLSKDEAELLVTFFGNLTKQITDASKDQPISIDDMTEILKRIPKKEGGLTGVDQYILDRYK